MRHCRTLSPIVDGFFAVLYPFIHISCIRCLAFDTPDAVVNFYFLPFSPVSFHRRYASSWFRNLLCYSYLISVHLLPSFLHFT